MRHLTSLELPGIFPPTFDCAPGLLALGQAAIVVLVQITVLLAFGLLAAHYIGPRRLAFLSLLYRALLVGVLIIGAVALVPNSLVSRAVAPVWSLTPPAAPLLPTTGAAQEAQSIGAAAPPRVQNVAPSPVEASGTAPAIGAFDGFRTSWSGWLAAFAGLWLTGAIARLMWVLLAEFYVARLRRGEAVQEPTTLLLLQRLSTKLDVRTPALVCHPQIQVPFLSGLWRPVIVLPMRYASDFDAAALEAILLHELAHLSRRDCGWKHLASLAGALLWVHPLMWLLCRRLEQVGEALCDETVLRGGCAPRAYANVLLNLSEQLTARPLEQVAGTGMVAFRSELGQRIQRIMATHRRFSAPVSATARFSILGTLVTVVAAVTMLLRVEAAPSDSATPNATPLPKWHSHYSAVYDRSISRDNTPEAKVGLPAKLADARGNSTITGRVVYENGKPAAGLSVNAYNTWTSQTELWGYKRNQANHYQWPDKINRLLSASAVTKADGTYRMTGLLPQCYGIMVTADRMGNRAPVGWLAPYRFFGVDTFANRTSQARDLVLRKSAEIRIHAIDADSGVPVEGLWWWGYTLDEANDSPYKGRTGDAHGKSRQFQPDMCTMWTDKNGNCTLSLDGGKDYFFLRGAYTAIRIPRDATTTSNYPDAALTSHGLYKIENWVEVLAPHQAPQRAWRGETEIQMKRGEIASFTIKLKRYRALTASDRQFLERAQKFERQRLAR